MTTCNPLATNVRVIVNPNQDAVINPEIVHGTRRSVKIDITDTRVDKMLDYIRKRGIHPVIDLIGSYILLVVCIIYYTFSYYKGRIFRTRSWCGSSDPVAVKVPLVTVVRTPLSVGNKKRSDTDYLRAVQQELRSLVHQFNEEYHKSLGSISKNGDGLNLYEYGSDEQLVGVVRRYESLRRIASIFVIMYHKYVDLQQNGNWQDNNSKDIQSIYVLYKRLTSVWLDLLRLPALTDGNKPHSNEASNKSNFKISLILPAFKERGEMVAKILNRAKRSCTKPYEVQVIVVHAGNTCPDLKSFVTEIRRTKTAPDSTTSNLEWGELEVVDCIESGGRGPCLNAGATVANGKILTFLHSDTILPVGWDHSIIDAFQGTESVHACTFRYSIDTSESGLDGMRYPWGIQAVSYLGRLRACLCKLPYGDHVISMPATYFWFIGGYPSQPLMEDYDLMDLLRQRAAISELNEKLKILDGPPVLCSPRRWQKLGVVYCTVVNAVVVCRYERGDLMPSDAFEYYYNRASRDSNDHIEKK